MSRFAMTYSRAYNWYISLVAASSMVLYGYDASVYSAVQGSKHWVAFFNDPNDNIIGAVNTAYTVGAIVASFFLAGPIADHLGRRIGIMAGAGYVVVATFMQTFSPRGQIGCSITGRVLVGIGQGLALTADSIYIGELASRTIRGKIMSFWQMLYFVGSFIAYWINFACSKHVASLGEWDWKMVVIFQLLTPILILAQVPFISESPRWLVKKGKIEQASRALQRARNTEQDAADELPMIREALAFEAEAISGQFFPAFLNNCGFYAFHMFAGINLLLAVFVWLCIPETKGVLLEEMDTKSGGQNHVEKGGDMLGVEDAHHADLDLKQAQTTHTEAVG